MICTVEEAKKKKCVFKAFIGSILLTVHDIVIVDGKSIDCCIANECMTAWRWCDRHITVDGTLIGGDNAKGYCGFGGKS